MKRRIEDRSVRKLYKHSRSYAITIPIEIIRELDWQKKQKVVVKRNGKSIVISDWKE